MGALAKQFKPVKNKSFLAFVAEQPCIVTGKRNWPGQKLVDVHHLTRLGPMDRITRNDRYCVPLAIELHGYDAGPYSVHRMGVDAFEAYHEVDLTAEAERLWRMWLEKA